MTTWSTDMRDLALMHGLEIPTEAARRAAFIRELVEATTSRRADSPWYSAICCMARIGRKACGARIHVSRPDAGRVEWSCLKCGERGVILGFEGTKLDMSPYVPSKRKLRVWGFDDDEREVLLAATTQLPALRAVVARASSAAEVEGLLVVQATVDELDEVYTLALQMTCMTRSRRRIELLDGLRVSLCSAMDAF